ncbi:MAG TPA: DUF3619 family protein [Rhodocyclaceae bacterium]
MINEEIAFGLKVRQALDQSASQMGYRVECRLEKARQTALSALAPKKSSSRVSRVGGNELVLEFLEGAKMFVVLCALTLGVVGTYYWNALEAADENADVDSALLADDLPIEAYADQGFHAWLEHSSPSSQ